MAPEGTEKLQYVYRIQQSKLVSISHLTENLTGVMAELETVSTEQKVLAGELESSTNRSRAAIRRLEQKGNKKESTEGYDYRSLSPTRQKSFLHTLKEAHDTTSSAAAKLEQLSSSHKYLAEFLDLSVITVKHFLWRENIFMAVILGGQDNRPLKEVSVRNCALGRWYDGKGKNAYSHLPVYRVLGVVHSRYHEAINKLIEKDVEKMTFQELSEELTKLEMLSQQLVGLIGRMQRHVALLQNVQSD
ncbi:CZB domain-containing protein [Salmonella enterica]